MVSGINNTRGSIDQIEEGEKFLSLLVKNVSRKIRENMGNQGERSVHLIMKLLSNPLQYVPVVLLTTFSLLSHSPYYTRTNSFPRKLLPLTKSS